MLQNTPPFFLLFVLEKLRELRYAFDSLDEHDDGQVGRDEFLACLDLDHPHLMTLLKATALAPAAAEGGDRGMMTAAADRSHSSPHAAGNAERRGLLVGSAAAGVGPATLSVFDAIEANDDEFVGWDEVRSKDQRSGVLCMRAFFVGVASQQGSVRSAGGEWCAAGVESCSVRTKHRTTILGRVQT